MCSVHAIVDITSATNCIIVHLSDKLYHLYTILSSFRQLTTVPYDISASFFQSTLAAK